MRLFEELDHRETPIGPLSLRRRQELSLKVEVFEIKLGDEFLMSSLFTASEIALAHLGLDALAKQEGAAVLVGGLGLGYTAQAALEHPIGSLLVIDLLEPVIDWHRQGLLPMGRALAEDERCRLLAGDFFALARSEAGFDPEQPSRRFDAILLDIDHSPDALLDDRSTAFYRPEGLQALARHLRPGGIFGLWSNEPPDPNFSQRMEAAFAQARAAPVEFYNPLQDRNVVQTVYLGRKAEKGSQAES